MCVCGCAHLRRMLCKGPETLLQCCKSLQPSTKWHFNGSRHTHTHCTFKHKHTYFIMCRTLVWLFPLLGFFLPFGIWICLVVHSIELMRLCVSCAPSVYTCICLYRGSVLLWHGAAALAEDLFVSQTALSPCLGKRTPFPSWRYPIAYKSLFLCKWTHFIYTNTLGECTNTLFEMVPGRIMVLQVGSMTHVLNTLAMLVYMST